MPLPIDLLPAEEARQLLAARLGGERLAAEPGAVTELVAACAGLPLALAIVAARAAARPDFPLAVVAEEVRQAGAGLEPWSGPDAATDLRAVFSWSYGALGPAGARLFRLLGLHPGPDLAVPAAASLAGVPLSETRRLLTALTEANLVVEHTPGRNTLHDLLRAYATELTETIDSDADRRAALHRILDHYLHTAHTARMLLEPHRQPPYALSTPQAGATPVDLHDSDEALAWLASDLPVLIGIVQLAASTGFDSHVVRLATRLGVYFFHSGLRRHELAIQHAALEAASRLHDRWAEAMAHYGLGNVLLALGNHDQAREHFKRALEMHRDLGDVGRQAYVHLNLGWLAAQQRDYDDALHNSQRAYEFFREADDLVGQGRALNMVGWSHAGLEHYLVARDHCERALAIQLEVGDSIGAGVTWDSWVMHTTGWVTIGRQSPAFSRRWRHTATERTATVGERHSTTSAMLTRQLARRTPPDRRGEPRWTCSRTSTTRTLLRSAPSSIDSLGTSTSRAFGNSLGSLPTGY